MSGYGQRASCHALRIGDEQGIAERARDHDGDCQVRLGWSDIGDTRGPGQSGGVSGYRFRLPEIFSQLQGEGRWNSPSVSTVVSPAAI
jgi:hypothetical protein